MSAILSTTAADADTAPPSVPEYIRRGFFRDPAIARNSGLSRIARSPAHYIEYCRTPEDEGTPALIFGRAFHCFILEPTKFLQRFIVRPDWDARTKAGKELRDTFTAMAGSRTFLTQDDIDVLNRMRDSVMAHPTARNLVVGGTAEREIAWTDPATKLQCGARLDFDIHELSAAVDLKSTDDANPRTFARSVATYRYHVQDVHYRDGMNLIGERRDHFFFIAVEKEAPFGVSVCYCDDAAIERGADLRERDMKTLANCLARGEWPCYSNDLQPIALPAWAFYE